MKISKYTTATPTLGTKLIGTQNNAGEETDNFTVGDILGLGKGLFAASNFLYVLSSQTQSVTSGEKIAMTCNDGVVAKNISLVSNSQITFAEAGVYNIAFRAQFLRASSGTDKHVVIWLRINGVNVPYSSTKITVKASQDYFVASWNFVTPVLAGDYAEIMWTQDDTIDIVSAAATADYPAIPSVIIAVNSIGTV